MTLFYVMNVWGLNNIVSGVVLKICAIWLIYGFWWFFMGHLLNWSSGICLFNLFFWTKELNVFVYWWYAVVGFLTRPFVGAPTIFCSGLIVQLLSFNKSSVSQKRKEKFEKCCTSLQGIDIKVAVLPLV